MNNGRFEAKAAPKAALMETVKGPIQSAAPVRFVPDTLDEVQRVARLFYYSGLMKKSFYYDVTPDGVKCAIAGITTMIMYGAELGLSPMQAMRSMHVIEGQPSLSAEGCVALLKRSPKCLYFRVMSESDNHCSAETVRVENDGSKSPAHKLTVRIWWKDPKDIPEATDGLLYVLPSYDKKGNLAPAWARTPGRMVKARCTMWLAHNVYEDVILGLYSVEEVVDFADQRTSDRIADDILSMVDMPPARPGRSEAPDDGPVEVAEQPQTAPTPPAMTVAEGRALRDEIKAVGDGATPEYVEGLRARVASAASCDFYGKLVEAWEANEVLGPLEVVS